MKKDIKASIKIQIYTLKLNFCKSNRQIIVIVSMLLTKQ